MSAKSTALVPIIDKDCGGLIVVVGPDSLGKEAIIGQEGPERWNQYTNTWYRSPQYVYAVVNEYHIDGRLLYAALFHELVPDHYLVYAPGESIPDGVWKRVTVPAGVVVQATFVQPRSTGIPEREGDCIVLTPGRRGHILGKS